MKHFYKFLNSFTFQKTNSHFRKQNENIIWKGRVCSAEADPEMMTGALIDKAIVEWCSLAHSCGRTLEFLSGTE